jgi:GNAT superfamily N-acetyltransferase
MEIRPLVAADIPVLVPAMAAMLRSLALEFIVHESTPEGASTFLAENGERGLRDYLARGHVYHVALVDGQLAGFIAMRDNSHVFHLFVGKPWQRRGLAGRLWKMARAAAIAHGGDGNFTVNASNHAVPAYEALGFVRVAPTQCIKGLYFNPMCLNWAEDGAFRQARTGMPG